MPIDPDNDQAMDAPFTPRQLEYLDRRFDAIDRRFDRHLEEVSVALGVVAEQMIAKMDARLDARTKAALEDLDRRNQAANEQIDLRVTRIEDERLPERVAALEAKAAPPPTKQPARRRRG